MICIVGSSDLGRLLVPERIFRVFLSYFSVVFFRFAECDSSLVFFSVALWVFKEGGGLTGVV